MLHSAPLVVSIEVMRSHTFDLRNKLMGCNENKSSSENEYTKEKEEWKYYDGECIQMGKKIVATNHCTQNSFTYPFIFVMGNSKWQMILIERRTPSYEVEPYFIWCQQAQFLSFLLKRPWRMKVSRRDWKWDRDSKARLPTAGEKKNDVSSKSCYYLWLQCTWMKPIRQHRKILPKPCWKPAEEEIRTPTITTNIRNRTKKHNVLMKCETESFAMVFEEHIHLCCTHQTKHTYYYKVNFSWKWSLCVTVWTSVNSKHV